MRLYNNVNTNEKTGALNFYKLSKPIEEEGVSEVLLKVLEVLLKVLEVKLKVTVVEVKVEVEVEVEVAFL